MNNNANALVWILVLVGTLIIGVAYYAQYLIIEKNVMPTVEEQGISSDTYDYMTTILRKWPYFALAALIVWGFLASQRREELGEYQEY